MPFLSSNTPQSKIKSKNQQVISTIPVNEIGQNGIMQISLFDEKDNLEQGFIDAKYGWSKYHIVMSVSNYDGIFIDCRVESHTDNYNCCEFEYDHSQDVDSTIKTAIDWIEKTLEEQKLIKN